MVAYIVTYMWVVTYMADHIWNWNISYMLTDTYYMYVSYMFNLHFMYMLHISHILLTYMKCFNFIYDLYVKYVNYMRLIYILPYMWPLRYMAEYMPFFICHIYDCSVWLFRMDQGQRPQKPDIQSAADTRTPPQSSTLKTLYFFANPKTHCSRSRVGYTTVFSAVWLHAVANANYE